ncbi:tryptophan synthase beta subunit-like PLP-dependent enzyme [Gongronella butleri]|nr:tryptophan synthase beta subunit-like PLP-dependent enzyme [Gongronella butleri]
MSVRSAPPLSDSLYVGVGSTPMIRAGAHNNVDILAKLEYVNPGGSLKDRVALQVLKELDAQDKVAGVHASRQKTLIVPSTGDFGVSVATLGARHAYRVICILPERTSADRVALLKALGVEIVRVPNKVQPEAPESAQSVAQRLAEQLQHDPAQVIVLDTASLPTDPYATLAQEIMDQTQGQLDFLFVGVASGTTITHLSRALKAHCPDIKVIGVEPQHSVLSGGREHSLKADWRVEDLGSHVVPPRFDASVADAWVQVSDKAAYSTARRLIRDQGVLCGPSSGAVMAGAVQYFEQHPPENHSTHEYRAAVILGDRADQFTSTLLSDDWLFENDLADDIMVKELEYATFNRYRGASVEDLQLPVAITVTPATTVSRALDLMLEREFSQLPVVHADNKKLVGYVSLASLQAHVDHGDVQLDQPIDTCMFSFRKQKSAYQVITPDTSLADLAKFFEHNSFAVVTDVARKWCLGVATKYDLISFLHRRQGL